MEKVSKFPDEATKRFNRTPHAETVKFMTDMPVSGRQQMAILKARAGNISEADDYSISATADIGPCVLCIGEETEKYSELLNRATERFNTELEAIEKRCYEHHENPEELLMMTQRAMDEMMAVCAEFERGVQDKDIIRNARIRFHEKTNPILSKSYCINRTRTWPQGSQGDHKTLEMMYKNTPLAEGIGYYLDLCALKAPLAVGVRNRMAKLEALIRREVQKRQHPAIMNIGCGSCRELMGLAPEIIDSAARIICIDSDSDALTFAHSRLSYAGIISQVELRKYNALRMFDDETNMAQFGKQDIIYSVGLFDYLASDFLARLFSSLYRLLNPGGTLIASFKDAGRYRSQDYHWMADWDGFLQRREEEFDDIMAGAGIPRECISETREDSGVITFYIATKRA
jgi:SAM-dependent methyltransferase